MPRYIEEMVSQQVHRSEIARQREIEKGITCTNPVVTISRTMGSGARVIAQKLADELGWSYWSKDLLDAIAEDANVSRKVVESFDEKTISELEMIARAAMGDHEMTSFVYAKHLAKAIASIGTLGNAIILGRGANLMLPDALHVRIDASEEHRINNMVKFENMDPEDAKAKIRISDKERKTFLIKTFGKQRANNEIFDLQIWMDRFTIDNAAAIIKTAIVQKFDLTCPI
ncbi:MAG: cytidylate kinase-like family protein [Armatimonadota bacterium]